MFDSRDAYLYASEEDRAIAAPEILYADKEIKLVLRFYRMHTILNRYYGWISFTSALSHSLTRSLAMHREFYIYFVYVFHVGYTLCIVILET